VQGVGLGVLGTRFRLPFADAVVSGDSHGLEVPWRGGTACGMRPLVPPPPIPSNFAIQSLWGCMAARSVGAHNSW